MLLETRSETRRTFLHDSLVLSAIILVSATPYLGGLGLYSDDWAFLGALGRSDGTFSDLLSWLMPAMTTRPVQALVVAGLYVSFGTDVLGWHLFNIAVLAGSVVLFYMSLRVLGFARLLAVAIPLVYGLLPHYSTDRVWIAAFQANVCVFLYFVSLYSDLRFLKSGVRIAWTWKVLGTVALVASVLAYEVTAALFLLNVLVLWNVAGVRLNAGWTRHISPKAVAIATNVAFLALTIGYKITTTERADVGGGYRYRLLRIFTEAVPVHFGELGLALPLQVVRALRDHATPSVVLASVAVGVASALYLAIVSRSSPPEGNHPGWPILIGVGFVLFGVGYGVALMTWEIGFHATGANNRTANGAAIGVGWVFTCAAGWVSGLARSGRMRGNAFASLIGLLAFSCTVLTGTIAGFWIRASERQQAIIQDIVAEFPTFPEGGTLLLDGVCPFEGPAPVFATGWDTTGMLILTYGDPTLSGDVVKPNTEATPDGVRTLLFDDVVNVYPYGDDLIAFHVGTQGSTSLTSRSIAQVYLDGSDHLRHLSCPAYTDGDGAPIFPSSE